MKTMKWTTWTQWTRWTARVVAICLLPAPCSLLAAALQYRTAPTVVSNTPITSAQWNQFCQAVNDRLRGGAADPTWRMWWMVASVGRGFCDTPAGDEWLTYWLAADPATGESNPDCAALGGSINPINPLSVWALGSEDTTPPMDPEDARLGIEVGTPMTAAGRWELAKLQRGARDPGGLEVAPAVDYARLHRDLTYSGFVIPPFLKSWGGFNRIWNSGDGAAYGVSLDWRDGGQFEMGTEWLTSEFIGTSAQRLLDLAPVRLRAFPFQEFFTRQYPLAPALGSAAGSVVTPVYPKFFFSDDAPPSWARVEGDEGAYSYTVPSGYVLAGFYAHATNTLEAGYAIIELLVDGSVVDTFRLTPTVDYLKYFPTGYVGEVSFQYHEGYVLAEESLHFEIALLKDYKPDVYDAYLLLRVGTTSGSEPDTRGKNYASAPQFGAAFMTNGCILSEGLPAQSDPVLNPMHSALRDMFRENLVYLPREHDGEANLIGYTVAGGVSVLRFPRYGWLGGVKVDRFKGIAPPTASTASGSLLSGVEYEVRGGTVTYYGTVFEEFERLTAVKGSTTYTTDDAGALWQVDGIIPNAPAQGWANEWLFFLSTHHDPTLDAENILNNRALLRDTTLDHTAAGYSEDFGTHWGYDTLGAYTDGIHVEAPSGYNFAMSREGFEANGLAGGDVDFYRSAQIYRPDYEVASCTVEGTGDSQVVVVTLATRLDHTDEAAEFTTYGTDEAGFLTEGGLTPAYRTDENALMEYQLFRDNGTYCQVLVGDAAAGHNGDLDPMRGCCLPKFYFTRLMPKAYVDEPADNDTTDLYDTPTVSRRMQWAHFILRAICEGYVDESLTTTYGDCEHRRPIEYTFRRICEETGLGEATWTGISSSYSGGAIHWSAAAGALAYQARFVCVTGSTTSSNYATLGPTALSFTPSCAPPTLVGFDVLALVEADPAQHLVLMPTWVRPDGPDGYGPHPNTRMYSGVFNQYSAAFNLLTRVRIDLPVVAEFQTRPETMATVLFDGKTDTNCYCVVVGDPYCASWSLGVFTNYPEAEWPETWDALVQHDHLHTQLTSLGRGNPRVQPDCGTYSQHYVSEDCWDLGYNWARFRVPEQVSYAALPPGLRESFTNQPALLIEEVLTSTAVISDEGGYEPWVTIGGEPQPWSEQCSSEDPLHVLRPTLEVKNCFFVEGAGAIMTMRPPDLPGSLMWLIKMGMDCNYEGPNARRSWYYADWNWTAKIGLY